MTSISEIMTFFSGKKKKTETGIIKIAKLNRYYKKKKILSQIYSL
jgi:hypothetical protein